MAVWERPVEWPEGVTRTTFRDESRFKRRTFSEGARLIVEELERFHARKVRVTSNVARGSARGCSGFNGVAVTFEAVEFPEGRSVWVGHSIACDNYDYASDNAVAISKTVEALRAIERHGSSQLAAMAMSGFRALPPSGESGPKHRPWREVLDIPDSLTTKQQLTLAKASFREQQRRLHPDHGGSSVAFEELTGAWAAAQKDLGV